MSGATTKTIAINSNDLGIDATLVLIFDVGDGNHKAYTDFYPFVEKVGTFLTKGNYAITLRYTNQLSFVKPEESLKHPGDDDDRDYKGRDSISATWVGINPGQTTTLSQSGDNYSFSDPTTMNPPQPNNIQAFNQCILARDIVVGYQQPSGSEILPQSAWLFPKVGVGYSVTTQFTPILRAYVAKGYVENQPVKTPFPSSPIWTQNLSVLDNVTNWILTWNASTGAFSITQYSSAPCLCDNECWV